MKPSFFNLLLVALLGAFVQPNTAFAVSAVTTLTPNEITESSARLNGEVTPDDSDASTRLYFKISESNCQVSPCYSEEIDATPNTISAGDTTTQVYADVSDLRCDTTYDYGIVAEISPGSEWVSGANVSFTTTACPTSTYTLTINKTGTGNGTITSDPTGINCGIDCSQDYDANTQVTITAIPQTISCVTFPCPSHVFDGWSGDCSGSEQVIQVTMDTNKNCTASFSYQDNKVPTATTNDATSITQTSAQLNGTVNPNDYDVSVNFHYGLTPDFGNTITASPSQIQSQNGATSVSATLSNLNCGTTYHYQVVASYENDGARLVNGDNKTFTTESCLYTLTVDKTGNGSGTVTSDPTGINCGTDCTQDYEAGTQVSLTATANSGSTFKRWTSDCDANGKVTMNTNKSCTAEFVIPENQMCGGIQGLACPSNQYCDIDILNACNGADLSGTCVVPSETCDTQYDPVCGCNGVTYANNCQRIAAKVQLNHYGACVAPTTAPSVVTKPASNIRASTATLNGSVNDNGAITTASFNFDDQIIPANPSSIAAGNGNTEVTANVTELSCATTHQYQVKAENSAGTSQGENKSFTLPSCSAPPQPATITEPPTEVETTSATLHAKVNSNGSLTNVNFQYRLATDSRFQYLKASQYNKADAHPSSIPPDSSITDVKGYLENLLGGKKYEYRVEAKNDAGIRFGEIQELTTKSSPGNLANLESPQQNSYESGIGLIRGWACQANKIEIQIDGGIKRQVAYGTARGDTQSTCGHSNTGFGYTYNWNALSNGTHNLKAFADNVQFADVNFTTTNLGGNYLTGLSGQHTINNFPAAGNTATLKWSEPHQNFVISNATRSSFSLDSPLTRNGITGNLESPQQGSYESGIGLIRGWMCQADKIEIQIDGGIKREVAYGTARGDTQTTCGHANTGFGYTYNWNSLTDLGNGTHVLRLLVNDQEFTNVNFTVTNLGGDYLTGLSRDETVNDFPQPGNKIKLRWAEPHQNFVIVP